MTRTKAKRSWGQEALWRSLLSIVIGALLLGPWLLNLFDALPAALVVIPGCAGALLLVSGLLLAWRERGEIARHLSDRQKASMISAQSSS